MRTELSYYGDQIEAIKISTDGHDIEFINAGDDKVGIRLDGCLRYFHVRGISTTTIKPTKTGISVYQWSSVMGFVSKCSDSDALWLAQTAFNITRPKKHHPWGDHVILSCPQLAC